MDSEAAHQESIHFSLGNQGIFLTPEEHVALIGNSFDAIAERLGKQVGCDVDKLVQDKRSHFRELQKRGIPPIQHVVDFAKLLAREKSRRGLKLAVASAAPKSDILAHLIHDLHIDHLFDLVLSGRDDLMDYSDPEGVNKPKPYIYQHAAKELGLTPQECVAIEDSFSGVRAGKSAGCFTIAVPNQYTCKHDLSEADLEIASFAGISIDLFFKMIADVRIGS